MKTHHSLSPRKPRDARVAARPGISFGVQPVLPGEPARPRPPTP